MVVCVIPVLFYVINLLWQQVLVLALSGAMATGVWIMYPHQNVAQVSYIGTLAHCQRRQVVARIKLRGLFLVLAQIASD